MSEWSFRVTLEYEKLREQRTKEIKNVWQKNWTTCNEDIANDQFQISWLEPPIKEVNPPMYVLDKCEPIPSTYNWVLSPRSFLVENQNTFFNIPFISDDLKEPEEKIFQNLLKRAENEKKTWTGFDILEDSTFVQLVQTLHEKYTPPKERNFPPDPIIFVAISTSAYCSKQVTPLQLRKKYQDLTREREGKTSNTCEQASKTFKKYFCRRCYIYNCELHRKYQAKEHFHNYMLKQFKDPIETFCGKDCWKVCKERDTSMNGVLKPQAWSDDERTLFRALQRIFIEKYCIIAQTILTRTCQQVFEFAQTEASTVALRPSTFTTMVPQRRKISMGWSLYRRQLGNVGTRHYLPCNHPGACCDNDCTCVSRNNACEKFCHCVLECTNRFFGCSCLGKCNSNRCPCFAAGRECDGDICLRCGACEYDLREMECKNVSIQRGLGKHLLLAPSDVVGWGIFIKDGAEKDDFISEYTGEMISQKEANRRGKIYDLRKSSFLFDLNDEYVLDATHRGSKIRFANHSINPNCYAKVMMVLGNHRIGIFAKAEILPGEELFFNYQYSLTQQLKFVAIERKLKN